ncbi:MAG: hypothetical protein KF705_16140 [Phycisphaeraceae bacterium]|nr:hypothetical protein [Phycisphaeraceae bacterium]
MSDTPSQGEPISLDSVIDELLESAAQDQSATTEEHAETTATPATEEGWPTRTHTISPRRRTIPNRSRTR